MFGVICNYYILLFQCMVVVVLIVSIGQYIDKVLASALIIEYGS